MSTFELRITRTIPAPPKAVFEAWTSPEALAKFMLPAPEMSVSKAESDAIVGGSYLVVMKAGDKELPHHGVYTRVDKYSDLTFTWNNPFNDVESTVSLVFRETDNGHTEMDLHHHGLPSEESRDNHQGGWGAILDTLLRTLS